MVHKYDNSKDPFYFDPEAIQAGLKKAQARTNRSRTQASAEVVEVVPPAETGDTSVRPSGQQRTEISTSIPGMYSSLLSLELTLTTATSEDRDQIKKVLQVLINYFADPTINGRPQLDLESLYLTISHYPVLQKVVDETCNAVTLGYADNPNRLRYLQQLLDSIS